MHRRFSVLLRTMAISLSTATLIYARSSGSTSDSGRGLMITIRQGTAVAGNDCTLTA